MEIHVLSEETINQIAAGEVVEKPVNVAKELIENAIDAGATAITCEIRDGGISLLRVTDNGSGIEADQVEKAFRRHATSKIKNADDLSDLHSLGFRGEALSSIAAVAQVELITKTRESLMGIRVANRNMKGYGDTPVMLDREEIGAPDGTSVIVRNLFYNIPVRRKFLKQPQTEAGYITDLIQSMALSHPDISFHYRVNGQEKLHTTGKGDLKEIVYRIYGKEVKEHLLYASGIGDLSTREELLADRKIPVSASGFVGRPEISRGTRAFESFFVNGRLLKSDLLSKAAEEGYGTDLMQHRFPFVILSLTVPPGEIDVNIHPSKMEIRFAHPAGIYEFVADTVRKALHSEEMIQKATAMTSAEERREWKEEEKERLAAEKKQPHAEPFESFRLGETVISAGLNNDTPVRYEEDDFLFEDSREYTAEKSTSSLTSVVNEGNRIPEPSFYQETLFSSAQEEKASSEAVYERIMVPENVEQFEFLGQIFRTYWLIAFQDKLLMIDQHAAHEKVNYERLMKRIAEGREVGITSQMLAPPILLMLTGKEEAAFLEYQDIFKKMGFNIDDMGGGAYAVRGIPTELFRNSPEEILRETLQEIMEEKIVGTPEIILSRVASMSCKAAVKGNRSLSRTEAEALIREMLTLEDPFHCPHGRPTMIELTKYEIDRKFKRIV